MKNLIILIAITIIGISCKKETVNPDPVVKTVIEHDTVYCTPLSDIIQGTWYCYKINSTMNSSSEQVNFTQTSRTWPSEFASSSITFNSDYSYFEDSQSNPFYVSIYNCSEIEILDAHGKYFYLRRNQ